MGKMLVGLRQKTPGSRAAVCAVCLLAPIQQTEVPSIRCWLQLQAHALLGTHAGGGGGVGGGGGE